MDKDFDGWNIKKKLIQGREPVNFFYVREVWWCYWGVNVGREEDGGMDFVRPVLILRIFDKDTFLGIALTSKKKAGKYYFSLGRIGRKEASANLSQVRLMDAKRLKNKIGALDTHLFNELKNNLRKTLLP